MPRNLDRRVEVLFPVEDEAIVQHVRNDILGIYLRDNSKARLMLPEGTYQRRKPGPDETELSVQDWLISRSQQG
jgi:polyphosphate kinase